MEAYLERANLKNPYCAATDATTALVTFEHGLCTHGLI